MIELLTFSDDHRSQIVIAYSFVVAGLLFFSAWKPLSGAHIPTGLSFWRYC